MTPVEFKCNSYVAKLPKEIPPHIRKPYLPIVFDWKKMDDTTGYPQLKVADGIAKCGYYTG
jgi:hypothetical protein